MTSVHHPEDTPARRSVFSDSMSCSPGASPVWVLEPVMAPFPLPQFFHSLSHSVRVTSLSHPLAGCLCVSQSLNFHDNVFDDNLFSFFFDRNY
jgi:hypothetical protein